jgi:hypothetical protein
MRYVFMKKLPVISLFLIQALMLYSREPDIQPFQTRNSFQVDLGGHGLFYSLNYERILLNGGRFKTASQAGVSYYPASTGIRDIWIPMGINEVFSFGQHHMEAGIGYMPIREATRDPENNPSEWFWSHMVTGRIGYRYQKPGGRLILRAAFTPVLEIEILDHGDEFHPLGGISVGYSF